MDFSAFFMQFLSGLSQGMLMVIIASGLSLVFGTMNILNFAHGSFYMLGAYFCFAVVTLLPRISGNFWIGLLLGPLAVAGIGGLIERFVLRRIYSRHLLDQLLLTYAFVLIFDDVVKMIWGIDFQSVRMPVVLSGKLDILNRSLPYYDLFLILMGPLILLGLYLLLQKTKIGRMMRATASDAEMMLVLGGNVRVLFNRVFILGVWLGGMGGALISPQAAISPGMAVSIIVESFIVVVIGGLGSFWGTLLGAFIFGQFNAFGILFLPRMAIIFPFVLMALVLIIRPWGLLGKPEN
ncbi:MAG TPA: branched-chain amino acid ABC transporter permease [Thermodesulfobacteriota bacterium]|nr:branched-chain amino acid ABC transporter permease [Thermodesulfobacteriota bacterium]